jgi:hypothetical protein
MTHTLGRLVEHDERSRNYAFQVVTTPKPEVDTFWLDNAPVLNQGDIGGCVGWTGADLLNTEPFAPVRNGKNAGRFFTNADGLKFYEAASKADSIPGYYKPGDPKSVDSGSSGLGLGKALKKLGLITSYSHAFSWHAFVQAILTQPVALGTLWTNTMFTPDANGVVHVGPLTNANIAGGHEYGARGISFSRGLVLCRNHWDKSWNPRTNGQKLPGEFWITIPDLQTLLANQGDVTVLHGAA